MRYSCARSRTGLVASLLIVLLLLLSTAPSAQATGIYWTNWGCDTIGRANLDGSDANQSFITGANQPLGVAVSLPEPASGLLLIAGLLGLAGWRRVDAYARAPPPRSASLRLRARRKLSRIS